MEKEAKENEMIEEIKSKINTDREKSIKKAIIAAAGLSTRFKEKNFCKSLININGISIINRHIFNLIKIGIKEIIITLNSNIIAIKEEIGNGNQLGINISYQMEKEILGTGGSLKKLNLDEVFLYISADSVFDMNYSILLDNYEENSLLLFKESTKKKYMEMGNKTFSKYIEGNKGYVFAGIGLLDGKAIQKYYPKENIFGIHIIFEQLDKEKKLKGITTNKPIFNINDYNKLCECQYYFYKKEKFIKNFCIEHKINTIIFDLDFTLFDSSDNVVKGINYSLSKLDLGILSKEKVKELTNFNLPRENVYKLAKFFFEDQNKINGFVKYYYEGIKTKYPKLYRSSLELLYFLKAQKFKLGIVTSKTRSLCIDILKYLEIYELFDSIICHDDVKNPKPHPDGLEKLMNSLNVNSENCLYIGDSINDAIPSKNINIFFFGVLTGFHTKDDFNQINEYFLFNSMEEILNYFRQLCLLCVYTKRYPEGVKEMLLTSEIINEDTKCLSLLVDKDPLEAMKLLLKADINSLESIKRISDNIKIFRNDIKRIIHSGNKIHFFGCGSSGRLLVLVERIMRKLNYSVDNFTFNISGGDTTVPKSFADFEDNINYGIRQLKQINYNTNDLVVTVSGSGTAPFLLEILNYVCINSEIKPYAIFCNEYDELEKRCKEHKLFNIKGIDKKINWFTVPSGPMSITGSTRLQATLVMAIVVQCVCIDLDYLGVLNDIIRILQNIDLKGLVDLAYKEYEIYQKNEKIIYDTCENCAFITMMDTTERTATFNLSPFKNDTDLEGNYSLCYLHIKNSKDTYDAMDKLFLKKPYLLKWKDYPKTNESYFYGFDFSKYNKSVYKYIMEIEYNNNILQFKNGNLIYSVRIPEKTHEIVFLMVFKTLINIYSNIVMGLMKLYKYNIMTNVTACNTKLIGRICYFVEKFSTIKYNEVLKIVLNSVIDLKPSESIIENCLNFIKIKEEDEKIKKAKNIIIKIIDILKDNEYFLKTIEDIENGASNKLYYRIKNINDKILILAYIKEDELKDFLKIHYILEKNKINIPKIENIFQNIIIQQDLGNNILTKFLLIENYCYDNQILDLINSLQKIKPNNEVKEYSKEIIFEEIKGFYDIFIKGFLKLNLNDNKILYLNKLFDEISEYLGKKCKKYFVHKDLNSSNIIINENILYLIDFQSAKYGSRFYDLISYLTDERVSFNLKRFKENVNKFLLKNSIENTIEIQNEILFNLLHRHIKNLGTFANLIMNGKNNYIYCIQNSYNILINILKNDNRKQYDTLLEILNNSFQEFNNKLIELNQNINFEFSENLIIITGPANVGKTSLSEKLAKKYKCQKINFDEMLINNIYNSILEHINMNDEKEKKLVDYSGKNLVYYVKHHEFVKTDPFLLKLINDIDISPEILKNKLDYLKKFIPNGEENLKYCFNELLKIVNTNKLIIDIAYLKKEDYIQLIKKNNNLKIIFCYLPIIDILKVIRKRNENSLLNNKPLEYRHPIHTLNHYINFCNINNSIIRLEQLEIVDIEKIIKDISIIDPYYKSYHRQDSRDPNILKENFSFPLNINVPNYPNILYLNKELQNKYN